VHLLFGKTCIPSTLLACRGRPREWQRPFARFTPRRRSRAVGKNLSCLLQNAVFFLCFFVRGDLIFVLHSYISHVFTFLFLVRDHECCQLSKKKRLLLSFGSGLSRCRHDWSFFLRLFDIKGVSFEHRFYRDDVLYSLDIFEHFALIKPSSCFLFFSLMLDMLAVITALMPSPPLYEVLQHVLYHHTRRVLVPNVPLMISFLALYQPL